MLVELGYAERELVEAAADQARESGKQIVNSIIADAVEGGALDIHFEPRKGDMQVRLRVDGVCWTRRPCRGDSSPG